MVWNLSMKNTTKNKLKTFYKLKKRFIKKKLIIQQLTLLQNFHFNYFSVSM